MEGAKNWKDVAKRLKGETVTYFDFETTGIADYDGQNITNDPVQLGAVQVKNGKIVKRFNVYINPESKLSDWSANNLKRDVVDENGDRVLDENGRPASTLVTPDWLEGQMSQKQALEDFIEFMGPGALVGGQNVPFDMELLKRMADKYDVDLDIAGTIDSKDLASLLPKYDPEKGIDGPKAPDRKTGEIKATSSLGPVANFLGFEPANWHSADGDAEDSYNLVSKIIERAGSEGSEDLSLLDFPAMAKRYKERMAEFKAVVDPSNPITEAQTAALQKFSESDDPLVSELAKDAMSSATTRGSAAEALANIHAADEDDSSLGPIGADPRESDISWKMEGDPVLKRVTYTGSNGYVIKRKAFFGVKKGKASGYAYTIEDPEGNPVPDGRHTTLAKAKERVAKLSETSSAVSQINAAESDPDFDDVELPEEIQSLIMQADVDDEESDSDFDDVDLSDFLSRVSTAKVPAPKPVSKPASVIGAIGQKAAEFAKKRRLTMQRNAIPELAIDVENLKEVRIPGAKAGRKAYAPSAEATEVKDEMVALGREVVDQAVEEILPELKAEGIIDESFDSVDEALAAFETLHDAANQGITDNQSKMKPLITGLRSELLEEATPEQFDALAQNIVDLLKLDMSKEDALKFIKSGDALSLEKRSTYNAYYVSEENKLSDEQIEKNKEYNEKIEVAKEALSELLAEVVFETTAGDYKLASDPWTFTHRAVSLREVAGILLLQKDKERLAQIEAIAQKMQEFEATRKRFSPNSLSKEINKRIRDKAMKTLKENGFKFDSVPLDQFEGLLITPGSNPRPITEKTQLGKMLIEAFQYVPRNVLLASIDRMKLEKRKLTIRQTRIGVRAHYQDKEMLIRADTTDSLLHEFWHFIQSGNKNIRALEHAWLFGRMADENGELPGLTATGSSSNEQAFAVNGLVSTYTSKQYADMRSGGAFFHPKNAFTEVSTTLMQDLFTSVGEYSEPNGRTVKTGRGPSSRVYRNAYYDEATGVWYADSTKQERIQPRIVYGRDKSQGIDYDFKAFGFGLLMALHDWEA